MGGCGYNRIPMQCLTVEQKTRPCILTADCRSALFLEVCGERTCLLQQQQQQQVGRWQGDGRRGVAAMGLGKGGGIACSGVLFLFGGILFSGLIDNMKFYCKSLDSGFLYADGWCGWDKPSTLLSQMGNKNKTTGIFVCTLLIVQYLV